jgi:haloalkane dehalogenase
MTLPDGILHYVDEGNGPPIVLVHGNPTWSFLWRKVISHFQDSFRLIAMDHLGMGLSSRPDPLSYNYRLADRILDLGYFLGNLEINYPVRLIAHDWGGPIALSWAMENPHKVHSLVLLNTGTRLPIGYRLPFSLKAFRTCNALGGFMIKTLGLFNSGFLAKGSLRPLGQKAREGYFAPYWTKALRIGVAGFVQDIPLDDKHPSRFTLNAIDKGLASLAKMPIFLVWGLSDFVFSPPFLYYCKKRLPAARVLALDNSGHLALEDEPKKILKGLEDFWKGHSPAK